MSDFQAVLQDSQKTSKSGTASGQSLPDWFGEAHPFTRRHIGPGSDEIQAMLSACGVSSLETLADQAVPTPIRLGRLLNLPQVRNEHEALCELKTVASRNQCFRSYIGMGYYDCVTPPVIQRNILENPGWYTQYTPYQAEIAQGRLEALLNFQTMIRDLTGMDIANASMLDEGTAAAEAMTMALAIKRADGRHRFFVDQSCHSQTIDVIRTRATPQGIEVVVGDWRKQSMESGFFGVLVHYPATDGAIPQYDDFAKAVHAGGAMLVVAADLLSLVVLRPPGAFGADIVVGNTQRFGLPMGFGGPHAAFFATQDAYKRLMPGRLIGVSKDAQGKAGLRLALQTREQHIRREKATSNICTAQVLLAIMASMYAVYHGPDGLRRIARRVHGLAKVLGAGIAKMGFHLRHAEYFDTLCVDLGTRNADAIIKLAASHRMNLRKLDAHTIGISVDETTRPEDVAELWQVFNADQPAPFSVADLAGQVRVDFDSPFQREGEFLKHAVFNTYHSETEMLRYIKRLESRDLSLTVSMTPLGSCTMKLNAAVEMLPITWPEFGRMHPFAPADQTAGFQALFADLEKWLAEITGFAAVSLQPNAGSQGEYTGLLTIRNYHHSRGQGERNICLIPQSAHGTNPASSAMAGFHVMPVACDEAGNIDLADLRAKATANARHLAALMVTYPSTHGVFEEEIKDICHIIHEHGGQVYMDGANMNAQVGLCRPGDIGADVCHLNLHKTFAIPHGGGGPGVGPICVASHLVPFLPGHAVAAMPNRSNHGAVCSAPYGSASILPISWTYIKLMGPQGLASATKVAILNANYVARRLNSYYPVLYKGKRGWVAHECILDLHAFKSVTVEDVAKRLMDFGFHAPTISFPVPGTIMVEPTESESKMELDRFCDAMIAIHKEIQDIESGAVDRINNPIKQAPHPAAVVMADTWGRPYSRTQAAYPAPWLREFKFWPAVSRIDNVYGDRNPLCTCEGMDAYRA